jgi:hypothetical protein
MPLTVVPNEGIFSLNDLLNLVLDVRECFVNCPEDVSFFFKV